MKSLASIETIAETNPIPGCDNIYIGVIKGWETIIPKTLTTGDQVVFFEVNSFLPVHDRYACLKETKTLNGKQGYHIKTLKLRGVYSQGFCLPVQDFGFSGYVSGTDVTEELGVLHFDYADDGNDSFPSFIPKTDEHNIQNVFNKIPKDARFYVSEKVDGCSCTLFKYQGEFQVASRRQTVSKDNSAFWQVASRYQDKLSDGIAIQGEILGQDEDGTHAIQSNRYGFNQFVFRAFSVYFINTRQYGGYDDLVNITSRLGMTTVPILEINVTIENETVSSLLAKADGQSRESKCAREGIVYRGMERGNKVGFKCISRSWLAKQK